MMARTTAKIEAELADVTADHTAAAERTQQLANQRALLIRELDEARLAPSDDSQPEETHEETNE